MTEQTKQKISRRDVLKAGGVLAVGLAYNKPIVEMIQAKPAFAQYGGGGGGQPSIEITDIDMSSPVCDANGMTFQICNGGDDTVQPHGYRLYGGTSTPFNDPGTGDLLFSGTFELLADECKWFTIPGDTGGDWSNYSVFRIEADQHKPQAGGDPPTLTKVIFSSNCPDF